MMNDMISRDNAIKCVLSSMFLSEASEKINKLPSNYGHWKFVSKNKWYECSKCGNRPLKNKWGFDELSSFCPYCGAHMGGKIVNE